MSIQFVTKNHVLMTNISSEDNIYGFCDPNFFRVGYISSNMDISNCSSVRTSHPTRYHYRGPTH